MITADGKIYVDGQPIKPAPSASEKYPAKDGYQTWIFKKVTFYIKRDGPSFEIIPVAQKESKCHVVEATPNRLVALRARPTLNF